jgi:DNA-directed RNA polymerase sigma subunit (sigma70/sigma32)
MRFGLDGDEPWTLQQIGELIDMTREWVWRIEAPALKNLRDCMTDN